MSPPRPGPKRAPVGQCPRCPRTVVLRLALDRVRLVIGPHIHNGDPCPGAGQEPAPCSA